MPAPSTPPQAIPLEKALREDDEIWKETSQLAAQLRHESQDALGTQEVYEQLEETILRRLQLVRDELRREIAEETRKIRAEMSLLVSQRDVQSLYEFQASLPVVQEKLGNVLQGLSRTTGVNLLDDGTCPTNAPQSQVVRKASLEPIPEDVPSDTSELQVMTPAASCITASDNVPPATSTPQFEAKFAELCTDVHTLQCRLSAKSEEVESAAARCESARVATEALHEELKHRISVLDKLDQIVSAATGITQQSFNEDGARVLDACCSLRSDNVRAQEEIVDIRTDLTNLGDEIKSVYTKLDQVHEAQNELRREQQALMRETTRKRQEAKAVQEQLQASREEYSKILTIVDALTSSCDPQVART